ncbi:MAG: leucyl-tRNA synthetase [Parcubacteria group bacterium Athens0714_26]|nr:MAG: leucyl-tRNA synthetase [Parcubacteria group bacterium Athens1014_26]TSD03733.1 MAG: leucyl-tRNA synthetase [Parcubacteria group bacterium Athens0714_26]
MSYNPKKIEAKWRKIWKTKSIFKTKDEIKGKKNFYHLVMFAYPSGNLHIGHWYNFAPADVYARFKRMEGFNVMSPIGFDAFGLPAENAAIKNKTHPSKWTIANIKNMTKQLEAMGNSYDWSRLVITCLPEYYKWNQWIFLKFFEKGLAYRRKVKANWCASCKTVLANEQVIERNRCERCSTEVIQKEIEQWMLKITDYADRLLEDLDMLDWPERTKIMQRNWIGRSEGAEIEFPVTDSNLKVKVFTTRADTLPGATYLVLVPEHQLLTILSARIRNINSVSEYIEQAKHKTELERIMETKDKTGVELQGITVINPFTKKEIPVWVSDYILSGYGTGAIMAVPAHDARDFDFAQKFNLSVIKVVAQKIGEDKEVKTVYEGDGVMINSGELDNIPSHIAKERIIEMVGGKKKVNYKLHDWIISRQRYWGTPIPIIHCEHCGMVPVPEKNLPVVLPVVKDYEPEGEGKSPLAKSKSFLNTKCPKCGAKAERETDTMDTFVDSSWYFIRYTDSKNKKSLADEDKMKAWLPVKMYIGGPEHAVMHLLYARFFTKFLCDEGIINFSEPFLSLRHQGMILGSDGQKMSKSRGNVVDPDELVSKFGADSVRMYLCFMSEYYQGGPWNPTGILGIHRFLNRVYNFVSDAGKQKPAADKSQNNLIRLLHKTVKKVGEDIEALKFNTAVSALMILLNEMEKNKQSCGKDCAEIFVKLLAPFTPHLAEELWSRFFVSKKSGIHDSRRESGQMSRNYKTIHFESWPKYNKDLVWDEEVEFLIQVNGKLRDKILAPKKSEQPEIEKMALESIKVKEILGGKKPQKIIFVPGKLINIVV